MQGLYITSKSNKIVIKSKYNTHEVGLGRVYSAGCRVLDKQIKSSFTKTIKLFMLYIHYLPRKVRRGPKSDVPPTRLQDALDMVCGGRGCSSYDTHDTTRYNVTVNV